MKQVLPLLRRFIKFILWLILACIICAIIPAIILVPEWQVQRDLESNQLIKTDIPKQTNEYRKTLIQLVGGIVLTFGLYLTWRRIKAMEDTVKVTEEGQITDRFSKAIEHLGSEQLSIRLGGIYALERIARDSKADHWTVIEVLSAFIRNYKPDIASQDGNTLRASFNDYGSEKRKPIGREGLPKLPTDVQAALTVIGKRNVKNDPMFTFLDLSESFLQRANLADAKLEGAKLSGANLADAKLEGADLRKADLGKANLRRADLEGADFEGAYLFGANLSGADLMGAKLEGAKLRRAKLEGATAYESQKEYFQESGVDISKIRFRKDTQPYSSA